MARVIIFFSLMLVVRVSLGGPIADYFLSGYGGVAWGTSLTNLVGVLPQGEHHFSTAPGERVYIVRNDEPLLGVPRLGTTIQYHLGKDGGVEAIAVDVPYERRDQLMGTLLSLFGGYATQRVVGSAISYYWTSDHGISLSTRSSQSPKNGILEFWISRISNDKASTRTK